MRSAAFPDNELERIEALKDLAILDSVPEQSFDDLALLAATICDAPASLVSLDDGQRQWFKSSHGIGLEQTGREMSFCAHAILQPGEIMEVPDATQDERFADNPLVTGEQQVRFYVGAPLVTEEGHALGTLCVLDRRPRHLKPHQRAACRRSHGKLSHS
ncbi:sensor histidine kinase [mine drainage metagenome]|uniref:Sensor histidine kinase n=1 Tax=mine drainage metagenome TaxID=410659 RepID=T1B653_9ZZZZ